MAFQECVIEVAQDQAEAWSDALFELGALSVSVEDADADTPDEQPLFGEPGLEPKQLAWNRSRVVALFGDDADPAVVVAAAANQLGIDPVPAYQLRAVEDQDWVRLTQSQFEPIRVGERIWVVPSWHDAPEPDAVVLELDPGLAFGTGQHATTAGCLDALDRLANDGRMFRNVADVGTGTGLLAFAALALWPDARCIATDIDPTAVDVSHDNAAINGVKLGHGTGELLLAVADGMESPMLAARAPFDLLIANILAGPLIDLAPNFVKALAPGGTIILDHGMGITAAYSHLQTVSVKVGQRVKQGQVIGSVGSTGRSTGPHLDWRVNWFDVRLDPQRLLPKE